MIFHTASPVIFNQANYNDVVIPALHGTITMLQSALEFTGPQLESVVITSSVGAIYDPAKTEAGNHNYTEAD